LKNNDCNKLFALGISCLEKQHYLEAEDCFRKVRNLAPGSVETILNLGYALDKQGRSEEALSCYEAVLAVAPENAKARYNRAIHQLRSGNIAAGFADYESRFSAIKNADNRIYTQPRWDGSQLNGRSILVYCEQGLGDAIQFSRYLPSVIKLGGQVVLEVQQPLVSLFSALSGIERVIAKSDEPPLTDCYIPLLSLPHIFGTTLDTVPPPLPHLVPDPSKVEAWRHKLADDRQFRVGLVWRGSATNPMDGDRSCPLAEFVPLLVLPGVSCYSLQVGPAADEIVSLPQAADLINLTAHLDDFSDTAALVANLDLIISVDTAVAHLAGAMGKPVWIMLVHTPDWRWMLDRDDSPWYPTARLFRQPQPGDWNSVAREIASALQIQLSSQEHGAAGAAEMPEKSFQHALADIENGNYGAAVAELRNLLLHLPDDPAILYNLGRAYEMTGQLDEARRCLRQALFQNPDNPSIWLRLGDVLLKQKSYAEAETCLQKAHELSPESVHILSLLGAALVRLNKMEGAFGCCRKMLASDPECLEAVYNLAYLQLRSGDYLAGFANFEVRFAMSSQTIDCRSYPQPRWDGSPLHGRSILVFGEQGLGDVIQFSRYIPLVAERGGKVILEIDPPLIPLFTNFPGVSRVIAKSGEPPLTDVYVQMISLPYLFGTSMDTVPASIPYIVPDAAKLADWQQLLAEVNVCRIGLVWRGNPRNPVDLERSCPLAMFSPLAGLAGVRFFSLQVGSGTAEIGLLAGGLDLVDHTARLKDLSDTAAFIANLDLVICVDTAVAHLAGAMGKPVWIMLSTAADWRWISGMHETPWYPTARLFWQERSDDWIGTIAQVKEALAQWLEQRQKDEAGDIESLYLQGCRLKENGDLDGAECCFRQITEIAPELPDPQHSLGVILQMQARSAEAVMHYKAAIAQDPCFVQALYNLANALVETGRSREAVEHARAVIKLDPTHADAHWFLGMLLLLHQEYSEGWAEYEWRWQARGFLAKLPDLGRPLWDGSPIAGKTLLIQMEQGRGDIIQFIRFARMVAASGAKVIVRAVPELLSLLSTAEGVSQVYDQNGPLPEFDLQIPAMSLPYVLGITLETLPSEPYLRPDPQKVEKWRKEMPDTGNFRIGLVWQGASENRDNRNRSCSLAALQTLAELEGLEFYSLQMGEGSDQCRSKGIKIIDLTDRIKDFADTAAMIENLDLVITICTAVAHLAGALGKPVWTMLHFASDWRWHLERSDSQWYPSMKLFRQSAPGDWAGVIAMVRQELSQMFDNPTLYNQRGLKMMQKGDPARAELAFAQAIKLDHTYAEAHCNRGAVLDALGRTDEALNSYSLALQYQPDLHLALFNMGNTYRSLNKLEQASACYQRAVELKPDLVPAHLCLGEIAREQKKFDQAASHYELVLSGDRSSLDALQGLAETYQAEERFDDAIDAYRKVLESRPDRAAVWNLLGTVYHSLERLEEAEHCYRQALTIMPDQPIILNNLGVVLNAKGRLDGSVVVLRHLIEIKPDYAEGHWNLSVALLAMGHYREGWPEFEWRFKKSNPVPEREFDKPRWDGAPLNGKTILLHAEQGFGDTIQFVRYIPLVAELGGKVIIECQVPALKRLLQSIAADACLIVAGDPLPGFDCHLPLMSLPLVFGTTLETIPPRVPYLAADPADIEIWRDRLGPKTKFRVGLVWFAKQTQVLNRKRSCALGTFAPLWDVGGVEFHSMQVGIGTDQLEDFRRQHEIIDLTLQLKDFADTAAYMANLDLVITIDTAVAHLAGALGVPVWVVLPHVAEWRWLCRRDDSPWYPGMRLFRQPAMGDWPGLIGSVAGALKERVQDQLTGNSVSHHIVVGDGRQKTRIRVGLAWSGRQDNPLNRKRSLPFRLLKPLFDLPGIDFVSLQIGAPEPEEVNAHLWDLTQEIKDFEETAALMANLDLIITIDTSVAHLAAASGRPTWVLLAHVADWRWSIDREDSPWYPGIKLFRQPDHGDWGSVIREVAYRLAQYSGNRLNRHDNDIATALANVGYSRERQLLEQQLEQNMAMVRMNANCPDALLDVGASLALLGRHAEAAASFRRVLELNADHVAGHLNLAYSLLALGEYSEGWQHLQWRLHRIPAGQIPPWPMLSHEQLGTHPHGTSVLVHCEQGYGDTIQFTRFLPMLVEAGYLVIVSCQPPMASLVASIRGVNQVVQHGEQLLTCDLQVLLLSLPRLFDATLKTLPVQIPYLAPRQQRIDAWRCRLDKIICRGENII